MIRISSTQPELSVHCKYSTAQKHQNMQYTTDFTMKCSGYMSPEYAMEGLFSVKSDVYSFGILVLEIVSGRRNNSFHNMPDTINILGYVRNGYSFTFESS